MADMTIEHAYVCATNLAWEATVPGSRAGTAYVVRWCRTPHGEAQYGWTCECVGFSYRGRCKHVDAVKKDRCAWNWEMSAHAEPSTDADGEPSCPECGGPVEVMKVAT